MHRALLPQGQFHRSDGPSAEAGKRSGSGVHEVIPAQADFRLRRDFSGAAPGTTTLCFVLSEPADVRLLLLDARGRGVLAVVRKGLPAGSHRITLNTNGLVFPRANCACLLQVTTPTGTATQTMPVRGIV